MHRCAWAHLSYLLFIPSAVSAQLNGTIESCVGDQIRLYCTVQSRAHIWEAYELRTDVVTERNQRVGPFEPGQYFIELTADNGFFINTSLSLVTFADLNNTIIACRDGLEPLDQAPRQETTVMVYGKSLIISMKFSLQWA